MLWNKTSNNCLNYTYVIIKAITKRAQKWYILRSYRLRQAWKKKNICKSGKVSWQISLKLNSWRKAYLDDLKSYLNYQGSHFFFFASREVERKISDHPCKSWAIKLVAKFHFKQTRFVSIFSCQFWTLALCMGLCACIFQSNACDTWIVQCEKSNLIRVDLLGKKKQLHLLMHN